ncbi:MAG: hypothetical protein RL117_445 [Verrucomicrobiota bacterium]|jgi:uncharacterized protein YacL
MSTPASVTVARLTYLLICELLAVAVSLTFSDVVPLWVGVVAGLSVAGFFILIESTLKGFTLRGFSTATFGLGVGLFCAWLITRVDIAELAANMLRENAPTGQDELSVERRLIMQERADAVRLAINVGLYASLGFVGSAISLRSNRDDFSFIIPFVRFRQEGSQGRPIVLDAEAVMDSRVINIARAGFLGGRLTVPSFVLQEIQNLAASSAPTQRQRGQRGVEILDQMHKDPTTQLVIHESDQANQDTPFHTRMIEVARLLDARLLTTDETLAKIARLQGLLVLNLQELTEALKPNIVVGEKIRLALVRPGKDDHQAVGYLTDGTMIVVNHSAELIGTTQNIHVISTLQTSNGLMVFAELDHGSAA